MSGVGRAVFIATRPRASFPTTMRLRGLRRVSARSTAAATKFSAVRSRSRALTPRCHPSMPPLQRCAISGYAPRALPTVSASTSFGAAIQTLEDDPTAPKAILVISKPN
jgi:hypothetical protein